MRKKQNKLTNKQKTKNKTKEKKRNTIVKKKKTPKNNCNDEGRWIRELARPHAKEERRTGVWRTLTR
jgi:hypothetical protein